MHSAVSLLRELLGWAALLLAVAGALAMLLGVFALLANAEDRYGVSRAMLILGTPACFVGLLTCLAAFRASGTVIASVALGLMLLGGPMIATTPGADGTGPDPRTYMAFGLVDLVVGAFAGTLALLAAAAVSRTVIAWAAVGLLLLGGAALIGNLSTVLAVEEQPNWALVATIAVCVCAFTGSLGLWVVRRTANHQGPRLTG